MIFKRSAVVLCLFFVFALSGFADQPVGVDTLTELYAPLFAGPGAFATSQGAATASSINPAAGGGAQLINFDAAYMALNGMGDEDGFGHAAALGALFPTKYAVFGTSLRFLTSPFDRFDVGNTFGGNVNIAKELYPGMSLGAGLNFGFGDDWSLALDLGFRHNLGRLWRFNNVTWALAIKNLGKAYPFPAFTPVAGIALDLLTIKGEGKTDPLRLRGAADLSFPGCTTLSTKFGLELTIAELIVLSSSLGFNVRELIEDTAPPLRPSVGLFLKFALENPGRALPDQEAVDGELALRMGAKPLPADIWGIGAGVSWTMGVPDSTAPVILANYPETQWISPNNDGLADALEFPIDISDQRYVVEWTFEIQDESGETVRSYRNKERRPETQGKVQNIISRLSDVKSGVDIPETLRWDGILDSGAPAPDGRYFFVISAADDNGNRAFTGSYEVYIDTTPPEIELDSLSGQDRIFSPDGDGSKDVLRISQRGSEEDNWDSGIYDASGVKVKSFDIHGGEPKDLSWDGTNDSGDFVPDGVYSYRVSATDRAKNTSGEVMDNIIVSTIQPSVGLPIAEGFFSPNGDGVKDTLVLHPAVPVSEGIVQWLVEVKDASGNTLRSVRGSGELPRNIDFDGKTDSGALLAEGNYHAALAVSYRNGYVSRAQSPDFTLDITAPTAAIRSDYSAFSPNNDGSQDTMVISQEGSDEAAWTGEVRDAAGNSVVRTFRFSGRPASRIEWDGRDDGGRPVPDGSYEYLLSAVDAAGNTGRSGALRFVLSTADTPVMISTDSRAFSPNGDGSRDTINILPQFQVKEGIRSYTVDILNSADEVVRSFEGGSSVPAGISWNGRNNAGTPAPDGLYSARIQLIYAMGNQPSARSQPFTLDTQAPELSLSTDYTLFSPNGDGRKDTLPITVTTRGDDEWQAVILDPQGNEMRSWTWRGSAPALEWNGADRAGNIVPDGNYRFVLSSEDEAGNKTRETINTITVDSRIPRAFFTVSSQAISPKEGARSENTQTRFSIILNPRDNITDWKLEIKDESGTVRRSFPVARESPASTRTGQAAPAAVPETLDWDGKTESGQVVEGRYTAWLTVNYEKGDLVNLSAGPITVDISGPVLGFSSSPEYFSPDNDGVDDDLYLSVSAEDLSPIATWSLEIREPVAPFNLFYRVEGRGAPANRIVWDGRSGRGELVQAATDYPVKFRASDTLGNASELDAVIGVDVLVIRDGDLLRIQVPSILFRENAADFESLAPEVVANNLRVLRRIAEILNKFQDYRVTVEGHANPVSRTAAEEQNELQPLSEARARAIVDRLTEFGVTRNRLTYVGKGGTRPVVRWEDRDNWWKNRRVEFILIK